MLPVLRSDCKSWGTVTQLQSLAPEGLLIGLPENTITFLTSRNQWNQAVLGLRLLHGSPEPLPQAQSVAAFCEHC